VLVHHYQKMREGLQQIEMAKEQMQQLRSKATELLLREEWEEAVLAYCQFINLCQDQISQTQQHPDPDHLPKLHRSLCLALSNRAEARSRLREFAQALKDCDQALKIGSTHFKTLLCKGKILLNLNRYSMALDCFKAALLDPQVSGNAESLNGYLEKCKKLEFLSRTGAFDLSDWVVNGYRGKPPELAEYIGAVQIRKSGISGRGLFATKNIDAGTLVLVTKAIATERGILPSEDSGENAQLVMWKNFILRVADSLTKCPRTCNLMNTLWTGEDEDGLEVPDISLFRPEAEENGQSNEKPDMARVLSILDVNSLVEDAVSFINHSCSPNARRLHVGDYVMVHTSGDVEAGEEITLTYYDALSPFNKRKEMSKTWGFQCNCKRCKFKEEICWYSFRYGVNLHALLMSSHFLIILQNNKTKGPFRGSRSDA